MASPVDTSVKWTHARMAGALDFAAGAGSFIALLDAFLQDGYALKTVTGGVIADGVCTLSFSSGVGPYEADTVIVVNGASPSALNGEQKLIAATANSVSFATALSDGVVTGSVTFKCAPCGWEKVFSKTNVAVYRPTDVRSSRFYLRVDCSNASWARVMVYESMSSVDIGVNGIPTAAILTGGYVWPTGSHAAKDYMLFADGAGIYAALLPSSAQTAISAEQYTMGVFFAGDINSFRSGDPCPAVLTGSNSLGVSYYYGSVFAGSANKAYSSALRSVNGLGTGLDAERWVAFSGSTSGANAQPLGGIALSADTRARFTEPLISNSGSFSESGVRGAFPGALACLNSNAIGTFGAVRKVVPIPRDGRVKNYMSVLVSTGPEVSSPSTGLGFIDITGPWRE